MAWRKALDTSEASKSSKATASKASPASNGRRQAASTQSTIRAPAILGLAATCARRAAMAAALAAKSANPSRISDARGKVPPAATSAATDFASAMAAASASSSSGTSRSTSGRNKRDLSGRGCCDSNRSSAPCAPRKRGKRWLPPAPGHRPMITSGKPMLASPVASLAWAARASSAPAPSVTPCRMATTGVALSSMRRQMSETCGAANPASASRRSSPAERPRAAASPKPCRTIAVTSGSPMACASA